MRTRPNGFTLVEMAVVLVIIGLLLAGLMMPLSAQVDQRPIEETRKAMDEINLGGGNDYPWVGGTITGIDGGGGTDRVYLTRYTTADCATLLAGKVSSDIGHVKASRHVQGRRFHFPLNPDIPSGRGMTARRWTSGCAFLRQADSRSIGAKQGRQDAAKRPPAPA